MVTNGSPRRSQITTAAEAEAALTKYYRDFDAPDGWERIEFLDACHGALKTEIPPSVEMRRVAIGTRADGSELAVLLGIPRGAAGAPVLLYFHGGGWTYGSPWTHQNVLAEFASLGFVVVGVDYALAPEAKYPSPLTDGLQALDWVKAEAAGFGGSAERIAAAGDSAGACIAAGVAIADVEHGSSAIRALVLFGGIFDYHAYAEWAGRTAHTQLYIASSSYESLRADRVLNPILGVSSLPRALVIVGTDDPLLSQSLAMIEALKETDVPHESWVADGAPHNFLELPSDPSSRGAYERATGFLHGILSHHDWGTT